MKSPAQFSGEKEEEEEEEEEEEGGRKSLVDAKVARRRRTLQRRKDGEETLSGQVEKGLGHAGPIPFSLGTECSDFGAKIWTNYPKDLI